MAFQYRRREAQDVEKRATQQGGDFVNFIKDEFKVWSPKKGDNWVRILPPTWEPADHYGMDIHVHYGVGPDRGSLICNNKQFGKPCALCEARVVAERKGEEELAKDLKPSKRVGVWMLDMKDEDAGPQVWPMAWTVDRDIAKISRDKRSGEIYYIDDPEEGFDVMFDRDGEGVQTKYSGFQLARRPSSVRAKWLDYIQDNPLDTALLIRTYDEVVDIYSGGMGHEVQRDRREGEVRRERTAEPERRPSSPADDRGSRERTSNGCDDRDERSMRTRDPDPRDERGSPARDFDREHDPRRSADDRDRPDATRAYSHDEIDRARSNGNGHARDADEPSPRRSADPRDEDPARRRRIPDERDDRPRDDAPPARRRIPDDEPAPRRAADPDPRDERDLGPRRRPDLREPDDEIPFDKDRGQPARAADPGPASSSAKDRAAAIRARLDSRKA